VMRERLVKFLKQSDLHNRFQVYYPCIPNQGDQVINLHAKVMIIDDELIRIGSSNLNNRSMGLDSECDLAIEACGDPRIQEGIATLRNRLMSEHLNTTPLEVDRAFKKHGSAIAAIEGLSGTGRSLRHLPLSDAPEPDVLVSTKELIDPEHPVDPEEFMRHYVDDRERPLARKRIGWWSIALLVFLISTMVWRWTPLQQWLDIETARAVALQIKDMTLSPLVILLAYLVASILAFPLTIMIIATLLMFGSWLGFVYALSGAILGALASYYLGYLLGRKIVRKMAGSRLNKLSRRLARRGLLAVITVRIIPIAPFTVVNMVAGASHICFRDYVLGTLIGMTPGIVAITLFTDRIIASIAAPGLATFSSLATVIAMIVIATIALHHWLGNRS
jgi:phospholipase D1/2